MKNISPEKARKQQSNRGMTLLEISMVLSVLMGLISILFVGVTSFNKGSSRAKCVLIQSKLQKVSISYANLNGLNAGDSVPGIVTTLVDEKYVAKTPTCPDTGTYSFLTRIPNYNEQFVVCSIQDHVRN